MKLGKASGIAILVLSLLSLGSILLLYAGGFRFFTIATPSMAETAPVGTLIVTQPQADYREQDIISFYRGGDVYTHRLVRINADHSYVTKGDLNAAEDSQPVKHHDVIGKAVVIAPIWGWVWRVMPILVIGWTIVYLISCIRKLRDRWRWPIRIVGGTLVLIIATFIVNPWLRVNMLSIANHQQGEVRLHIVNTGIFPIRDDDGNRVYSGQTATVRATNTDAQGRYVYIPRPSLGALGVLFAMLWCLLPLFVALLVKLPPPEEEMTGLQLRRERRRNMALLAVVTLFEIIMLLIQLSSLAAFTAEVQNTTNTVSTRTYFTCRNAVSSQARPRPYFAWGMLGYPDPLADLSESDRRPTIAPNETQPKDAHGDPSCLNDGIDKHFSVFHPSDRTCLTLGANGQSLNSADHFKNFSLETWFNAGMLGNGNGRMIGFGSIYNGNYNGSGQSDRHVYIDKYGKVLFGTWNGSRQIVKSQKSYADNKWHHMVATMSTVGNQSVMKLYLDGKLVDSRTTRPANDYAGYWKVGCGRMLAWEHSDQSGFDGPAYFAGKLQFAAVYQQVLTDDQVREHYEASGR